MSKRTRKPALKLREFVQSGAGDLWIADEDIDHTVPSGTEECWRAEEEEDIDLRYIFAIVHMMSFMICIFLLLCVE